jgi:glycosyltransferase involved in cell wall biosynthesis
MNIGIEATSAAEPQKAGVGNYTYNLIRAIALLQREDHFYTLYLRQPLRQDSGQSWSDTNSSESPPKLVSKVLRFPYLWTQIRLPLEMRISPQDVYFFPSPAIPLIYQPAKSVITVHDVAFLFFPDCFSPMLRGWLNIATERGTSKAKKVIAVSESTRQDLISYYGVAPEKIVVVHHGVHEIYRSLPQMGSTLEVGSISQIESAKAKYRIEGPYILCIGTLQKRKNIPRLLQSFYVLKQEHNIPHKLVLVGQRCSDLPEHEIFSTMKQLSLQEDVVWTGYITDRDMPILLNGAELFVFPSLYEGFGMPILEAMACGVPVACSNTSSLPEVAGEAGMMFDPYDIESMTVVIHRALTDEALRRQLRQQGLQRAKGFSWERCAQKTLDVLEAVCYEK